MVSDKQRTQDPAGVSDTKRRVKQVRYDGRQRFYTALLLFVVIVGLPIVGVPSLRHRLADRVAAIKDAIGGRIEPVTAEIADEQAPFPKEYERYATSFPGPGRSLPLDRIFTARKEEPDPETYDPPALITPETASTGRPFSAAVPEEDTAAPEKVESDSEDGLGYNQGEVEQNAYAMLLESYPQVAEMVQGGDPALRFLSWGAVKRGEDIYWVRLIFQTGDNPKVEYIWRVELESKRILPLSHNARSIS